MVAKIDVASVRIWDEAVGAIAWDPKREIGSFEFEPAFLKKGIQLSPYLLDRENPGIINYPNISKDTYKGLPGFLADTLPDDFGNAVIDAWLARAGRATKDFSPVERLCYTGTRGMGALEFFPSLSHKFRQSTSVEIDELIELANSVLSSRKSFTSKLGKDDKEKESMLKDLIRVGTSAGGQRPKAVLAIHPKTKKILSGQTKAPNEYEYWIIKFDGVKNQQTSGVISDPQGFGKIEYAYYKMAMDCKIQMTPCTLLEENGRSHFLTKRFDRSESGEKTHQLSLCGMAHFDYHGAGKYGYEQVFQVMRKLKLDHPQAVQMFRRMVFNVVARNQDDHTKNIAFLMDRNGQWLLSPAFDVTYSYNPVGQWTSAHQMTINGKRDNFSKADLEQVGKGISLTKPGQVIEEICDVVSQFSTYAKQSGIESKRIREIQKYLRLRL